MQLTVESLHGGFEGYGIVASDRQTLRELGVDSGDFVGLSVTRGDETRQCRRAIQVAVDAPSAGIAALDDQTRQTLAVDVGASVRVEPLSVDAAHRVVVSLARPDEHAEFVPEIRARLGHRIVAPSDELVIPVPRAPDGSVELTVKRTVPDYRVGTRAYTTIEIANGPDDRRSSEDHPAGLSGSESEEPTFADVGGQTDALRTIRERVVRPLTEPDLFDEMGITPSTGVLLHGPPGTGKTLIARALANETDAHFETISAGEVLSKWFGESESNLRSVFDDARQNAPAIVYVDELDAIAADRDERHGPGNRVVNELLTQMDGLDSTERVVVVASTNRFDAIDPALRRPGRFDQEVEVGRPDTRGRRDIMEVHTNETPLADDVNLKTYAERTNGWTGADLEQLVREATLITMRGGPDDSSSDGRHMSEEDDSSAGARSDASIGSAARHDERVPAGGVRPEEFVGRTTVTDADFRAALQAVSPTGTRSYVIRDPDVTWDDVGGLSEVERVLREIVEWPYRYPGAFDAVDLDPATGVLLYGPPGTGKTLIAKAIANSADATFLSVRGPELLDSAIGKTESRVRDLFETARTHAPSIVFLDEFDAIAASRPESKGAMSIVAQLLTELDGLVANDHVTVVAATNRRSAIDEAVLREGRFDEHLRVGRPDEQARRETLRVHTRDRRVSETVDLSRVASETDGFTGAAIAALCRVAARNAVRRVVKERDESEPSVDLTDVVIEPEDFKRGLETIESESESDGTTPTAGTYSQSAPRGYR